MVWIHVFPSGYAEYCMTDTQSRSANKETGEPHT